MMSAGTWRMGHRMHSKERVVTCKICGREYRTISRTSETCGKACSDENKRRAAAKWKAKTQ